MKKRDRKGFTIVELVIVIAVIAILATVLVPTFGNVISNAKASAALQQVTNAYKEALIQAISEDGRITDGKQVTVRQFTFTFFREGTDATIQVENFPYSQVSIADGKVLLGPEGDVPETDSQPTESKPDNGAEEETVLVEGIALDQAALALDVGGNGTLTAVVSPANATDRSIEWSTSNSAVAVVADGVVTAVGPGTATITATAGGKTASCEVNVTYSTKVGSVAELEAALTDGDSVSLSKTFSCGKVITLSSAGTFIIDLNENTLKGTKTITVNDGVELIIMNGTFNPSDYIKVEQGGKLTIVNCTITTSSYYLIHDYGTVTITDSTITHTGSSSTFLVGYSSNEECAFLTLNNTSITSGSAIIEIVNKSVVDITGGALTCGSKEYAISISGTESIVRFHKDGENPVSITAKKLYTENKDSCFEGLEENTIIVDPS